MFPVETIPPQYHEAKAREAADAARKLAEKQRDAAEEAQSKAPIATQQAAPASVGQALLQRPQISNPSSSGVLGSIFQNILKTASSTSTTPFATPPRAHTPSSSTEAPQKMDIEALKRIADARKDADICALPGWH